MIRALPLLAATLAALPAAAQDHAGHMMPGMTMPQAKPADPHAGHKTPTRAADPHAGHAMPKKAADPHAGHAMPMPSTDPHAGHAMPDAASEPAGQAMPQEAAPAPTGTDLSPGDAPGPPVPMTHAADAIWGAAAMAPARDEMMAQEGGGQRFTQVLLDLAEVQGDGGYRWEGEAWWGGDIHRLVVKSEGEGKARLGAAEVQALYSRAIGPYFNLQAGVRHDVRPTPTRTYATIGVEGLAPYWFEIDAAAFLSRRGELLARVEGYYDQRVTQRLIVQPRAELNLSAQDIRSIGLGAGPTSAELGLRVRYEIVREFAPYVGVHWETRFGDTRRFARAEGQAASGLAVVAGIRAWF